MHPICRRASLSGLLVLLGLLAAVLPAAAVERPQLPFYETGELDGARYEIAIPENWNGGLVMYVHGYYPINSAYEFYPPYKRVSEFLLEHVTRKGYAWARSAFSRNGMNWVPAADENAALHDLFERRFGITGKVFLAGLHGGGSIVRYAAERHPEDFDGYLSMAGSGGSNVVSYRGMVSQRALFDYFFPGLPGSPVELSPDGSGRWTREQAIALMDRADPARVAEYLRMVEMPSKELAVWAMWIYAGNLADVLTQITGGRNPYDTTNQIYSGSDDDVALNRGIRRYAADPEAARLMREDWSLTGRIKSPMLAINSIVDAPVPVRSLEHYHDLVTQAGALDNYVQTWVDWTGENYTAETTAAAFDALEAWVIEGRKPAHGEFGAGQAR